MLIPKGIWRIVWGILGIMWMIWHLPAFAYLDPYDKVGLVMLPGFAFGVLWGAVLCTRIYNSTGASVPMAILVGDSGTPGQHPISARLWKPAEPQQ